MDIPSERLAVARSRSARPIVAAALATLIGLLASAPPPPIAAMQALGSVTDAAPVLGARLTIVSDGTEPFEDRPLSAPGIGELPGRAGFADPGDDLNTNDGVVRSADAIAYRVAYSLRGAPVDDLEIEIKLEGPATWEASRVRALALSTCPGGATLRDDEQTVDCRVGRVEAPPAITVAMDLTARVDVDAGQGATVVASISVRATDAVPDPVAANCPLPRSNGCGAAAAPVSVSAAPAFELRKHLLEMGKASVAGKDGWRLDWRLDVVAGADGDVRGTSLLTGSPWRLPDWWRATSYRGTEVTLPVQLINCESLQAGTTWSCTQPEIGEPVSVLIDELARPRAVEGGVRAGAAQVIASLRIELWIPTDAVVATGWDVTFRNCFATEVGEEAVPVWSPTDRHGQPNLSGLPEPTGNNCAAVVLPVPRTRRVPSRPKPPLPGTPGPPPTPSRATPTPEAVLDKHYSPIGSGDSVTAGTRFFSRVSMHVHRSEGLASAALCDKWDNATHTLVGDSSEAVEVWWRGESGEASLLDPAALSVEFAKGPWGLEKAAGDSSGRSWFVQSTATCADTTPVSPGWISAAQVDFDNMGRGLLDARRVNMVRVRLLETIPPSTTVWMEVPQEAQRTRTGTWLMNYGAAAWGSGSRPWRVGQCYGSYGQSGSRQCPEPAARARGRPGDLGDMLVYVGVPVRVTKTNDPEEPSGSPVIPAGSLTTFALEVVTLPHPEDPPPPDFPPDAYAGGVVVTDTLPAGMTYERGSATLASEDLNGNGALDPGEDRNANGRIDAPVGFEPTVSSAPFDETQLVWRLGDLSYGLTVPKIRFQARVSRLVRSGTALVNGADAGPSDDRPYVCTVRVVRAPIPFESLGAPTSRPALPERLIDSGNGPGVASDAHRGRSGVDQYDRDVPIARRPCAWAQVIVVNDGAAQVEKTAWHSPVEAGEPMTYRLGFANASYRPIEWFDGVDILPWESDPRAPRTRLAGGIQSVSTSVGQLEVWASATDSDVLDIADGGPADGLVDPAAAWGEAGSGLGGGDWPCLLADVGTARCRQIANPGDVTALRFWGADPAPGRSGDWLTSFLPVDGGPRHVDVTLNVPGSQPGDVAHNSWSARFEGLPLPVSDSALIEVRSIASPSPTPRPTEPTARPTPEVSATITPAVTAEPTSTPPTVSHSPIYLPGILNVPCVNGPVDVALVIDVSSSMRRGAGDGGTKLEAVLRAAQSFIDRLDPDGTGSRVAIVAFHDESWIVEPLTVSGARLDAALGTLAVTVAEGTRLDLGLNRGLLALETVERTRPRALVLLTDGMPNRVPTPVAGGTQEDTVLAVAEAVREAGVTIHTVGYGRADATDLADRISPWLLKAIAGPEGGYHETDDAAVLADIFHRLGMTLRCGR